MYTTITAPSPPPPPFYTQDADLSKVNATFANGVLNLLIAKVSVTAKTRRIEIGSSS